jgi:1-acyl-sn-glycerol-3-phosphate acyltransferase
MFFLFVVLMNLVMYPVIIFMTVLGIILFPVCFATGKIVTRWDNDRVMRYFVWVYGRVWMIAMTPFVRFESKGLKKGSVDLPCIIVVNHLSFFDTYCMALLPFSDMTFAVRSWPFKILFWYRPFMRLARYLDVEAIGWEGTIRESKRLFSKKGAVLFFPEGHRSSNGQVKRFYSGPFKLAIETGVPILPLCITGTDALLPPHRWWMMPATVCLSALPPVSPDEFAGDGDMAHINLRKHVRNMIMEYVEEMRKTSA